MAGVQTQKSSSLPQKNAESKQVESTSELVNDEHENEQEKILADLAENDEEEVDFESSTPTTTPNKSKSPGKYLGSGAGYPGYNALKSFNGQVYTGMAVGGSHTWNYDRGVWKETKVEPDLWKIDFDTTKRRDKNAPKGSGAPEGMEYHWLIVAHQVSQS